MSMLSRRAFLGAELPPDDEAFTDDGMRIAGVVEGGMAEAAGLVAGDVLVTLAGHRVRNLCELGEALRAAGRNRAAEIVTRRGSIVVDTQPQATEVGVEYGEVAVERARLRTLTMREGGTRGVVVMIQGIACESVEQRPYSSLAHALAYAGFTVVRFDKRGVGDSEGGPCNKTDFATELADARAVVDEARALGGPLYLFGHSVGAIIAPHIEADAYAVFGAPMMPWIECLLDSVRRQLALRGITDEAELDKIRDLRERGELNGRSAAYHEQLAALPNAWPAVTKPVLVLRGEYDWVVRHEDADELVRVTNGTLVDLDGIDHLAGRHDSREASLRDYGAGEYDDGLANALIARLGVRRNFATSEARSYGSRTNTLRKL
jgi:alpha-beta hydrolase superfamily lysophospholipase